MASKTTSSVGMMVSLAIFAVLCLVLFVATIVAVARVQRLADDLRAAETDLADAIPPSQRDDRWEELRSAAGNQGVVKYLDESLQQAMQTITGSRRDTMETMQSKVATRLGDDSTSLLAALDRRTADLKTIQTQLDQEKQSHAATRTTLETANAQRQQLQEQYDQAIAKAEGEVDVYTGRVKEYRTELDSTVGDMQQRVTQIRSDSDQTIAGLESELDDQRAEILILKDQIARLRSEQRGKVLMPTPEEAHVDGMIIAFNPTSGQVSIDRGLQDRMVLGLTFEVYDQGTIVRPDAKGDYPTGKATIEVTRIEDSTSTARIIRAVQGNPVVSGDLIVNGVYDPNKMYTFTVFGNFDANNDGFATAQEQQDIRALITNWGGRVEDDITGQTDFLVIGKKPVLPPEPKLDDPPELITRYVNLRQALRKYDELFEAAVRTGIPVLNENRLYTLTGQHAER